MASERPISLSVEEALEIYNKVMEETGSRPVVRDMASLEIIMEKTKSFMQEDEQSLIWKAAFIIREIISKHPFMDGNKRAALSIAASFLRVNGIHVKFYKKDIDLIEEIDFKKYKVKTVKEWLSRKVI